MKIWKYILIVLMGLPLISQGQQDPHYSFYMFNGLYVNPAYAGSQDVINMNAFYRHQWAGLSGAPQTGSFAVHSPFKNNRLGMGGIYTHDRQGSIQNNSAYLSYSYRIPLGAPAKGNWLSFGLQGGFTHYQNRLSQVNTDQPNDPQFSNDRTLMLPNFGAGVMFYGERYFLGASMPQALNLSVNEKLHNAGSADSTGRLYRHFMFHGGYVFDLGSKVKLKPSFVIRYMPNLPISADVTLAFLFIDRIWVGATYRHEDAYAFMGQFGITKQLSVGYAYELGISELNNYQNGTHEVMLGYRFGFEKKRVVNPRYLNFY